MMTKTNRATHFGTCQLCGHVQLLPGGRLSNHGYAVRWSTFVGTCPGSKGKPFEQSTDLIEAAIRAHEAAAANLRQMAADYVAQPLPAADATDATIPHHAYVPATWENRKSRYEWKDATVVATARTFSDGTPWTSFELVLDGKPVRSHSFGYTLKTLADVVRAARERRAADWLAAAGRHDQYIAWQRDRIAAWTPAELKARTA